MLAAVDDVGRIFVWSVVLIAFLAAGFLVVSYLRKWYSSGSEDLPNVGFTLSDLRELHRQGKMTDTEFAAAKAKVVAAAQKAAAKQPPGTAKSAPEVGFQQKGDGGGSEPDNTDAPG